MSIIATASEATSDAVTVKAYSGTVGNATEAAYFRSDLFELRRNLMEQWSGFLEGGNNR